MASVTPASTYVVSDPDLSYSFPGDSTRASTGSLTGLDAAIFASASIGSTRTRTRTGSQSGTRSSIVVGSTSATGGLASATGSTK